METIRWRYSYKIHHVPRLETIKLFLQQGFAYVAPSTVMDKSRRPLLYLKLGAMKDFHPQLSLSQYMQIILYSLERYSNNFLSLCAHLASLLYLDRAKKQSLVNAAGCTTTFIDFQDFSWSIAPSMSFTQEIFNIMKKHYPYRVGKIYVMNTSMTFSMLWRVVSTFIPAKVLEKIEVFGAYDQSRQEEILAKEIGVENVESRYHRRGGQQPMKLLTEDAQRTYLQEGYWKENPLPPPHS